LTFSAERDNICPIPPTTIIARSDLEKEECENVKGVPKVITVFHRNEMVFLLHNHGDSEKMVK
jgi:hypothetical protein